MIHITTPRTGSCMMEIVLLESGIIEVLSDIYCVPRFWYNGSIVDIVLLGSGMMKVLSDKVLLGSGYDGIIV